MRALTSSWILALLAMSSCASSSLHLELEFPNTTIFDAPLANYAGISFLASAKADPGMRAINGSREYLGRPKERPRILQKIRDRFEETGERVVALVDGRMGGLSFWLALGVGKEGKGHVIYGSLWNGYLKGDLDIPEEQFGEAEIESHELSSILADIPAPSLVDGKAFYDNEAIHAPVRFVSLYEADPNAKPAICALYGGASIHDDGSKDVFYVAQRYPSAEDPMRSLSTFSRVTSWIERLRFLAENDAKKKGLSPRLPGR